MFASIPVAAWLDRITLAQLTVVVLMAGIARVFFDIAYQSYVPTVVGRDRVLAGSSAMEFIRSTGQFAGSALGGLLVSVVNIIFMAGVVHLSAAKIGLIVALGAIAVTAGSVLTSRLSKIIGSSRIIWLALAGTSPLSVLGPLARARTAGRRLIVILAPCRRTCCGAWPSWRVGC